MQLKARPSVVKNLDPMAWILQLRVKTELPDARFETDLSIGPFKSPSHASGWLAKVRQHLKDARLKRTQWEIGNGIPKGTARWFDVGTIQGPARTTRIHRKLLRECLENPQADGLLVIETPTAKEFAQNIQHYALRRMALYDY